MLFFETKKSLKTGTYFTQTVIYIRKDQFLKLCILSNVQCTPKMKSVLSPILSIYQSLYIPTSK